MTLESTTLSARIAQFLRSQFLLVVLGMTFAISQISQAGIGNYNSILIGDQAAGMGGAAAAMTEDSSGMAWYNPATMAWLPGQAFSSAVGVYKKFDTVFNEETDITRAGLRANLGFFRAIPSSTASVIRPKQISWLSDWTLALSILVPHYEIYKGSIVDTDSDTSTLALLDETLWVGGALARKINERDSIGFSLYYTARSYTQSIMERTTQSSTQFKIFSEEKAFTHNALIAVFGFHRMVNDNWRFGASIRPRGMRIGGKGSYSRNVVENGVMQAPVDYTDLYSEPKTPTKITLGTAYVVPGEYTIAFDFNLYEGLVYSDMDGLENRSSIDHKPIANGSLGFEYTWEKWLKLRTGIFSNLSAHPKPDPTNSLGQGDHVDQAGFSANMAFISGTMNFTFGGYYVGGRGQSYQRIKHQNVVIPKVQNVFTMLVGTSYYY